MAIIDYVIIHNKSFELILTEDFFKKVTIRCEIVVDLCLIKKAVLQSSIDPQDYYDPQHSIEFTSP